jgi:hypothetical protein
VRTSGGSSASIVNGTPGHASSGLGTAVVPAGRVAVGARLEPGALVEVAGVEALALEQDVARREAVALGASLETPVRADLARDRIFFDAVGLFDAVRIAAIAVRIVAVVALLVGIEDPITTGGQGAVRVAVVAEAVAGAVVAHLFALDIAVAAVRERALHGAFTLVVVEVAVVAILVGIRDAITTVRKLAVPLAVISVEIVPVVALLREDHDAVAARRGRAVVVTAIAVDAVAVVAHLFVGDLAIAATRGLAIGITAVAIDEIPVVASFADRLLAVAATREVAVGITAVVRDAVAVVAGFGTAGHRVTTAGEGDGAGAVAGTDAVAGVRRIELVARLVGGDEAIAAGRGNEDVVREITAEENVLSHALVEETFLAVVARHTGRGVVLVQRVADVAPQHAGGTDLVGETELAGRGALAVQITAVEVLGVGVDGGILFERSIETPAETENHDDDRTHRRPEERGKTSHHARPHV